MIIRENSLSEQSILEELIKFIESKPDGARWKDFFTGSHGMTLAEWCAALGTFLAYQARAYRRESSALTANLKSTIYSMAYTFGYPVNRALSCKLQATITNQGQSRFWPRTTIIGHILGHPVSLASDTMISEGQTVVDLLIGQWESVRTVVQEQKDYWQYNIELDRDMELVDNELLEVWLNNERIDVTRNLEDIDVKVCLVKMLINTISVMFGSSYMGQPVSINDQIDIIYFVISSTGDASPIYNLKDLSFVEPDIIGEELKVIRRETPGDSLEKIIRVMPGYYASKRRMITPADHMALVLSYPGVIDTNFAYGLCTVDPLDNYDKKTCIAAGGEWDPAVLGCCVQYMSYLTEDEREWTLAEENLVLDYLAEHQIAGEQILFRVGEPVEIDLRLIVCVLPDSDTGQISQSIRSQLINQCYLLGGTFNTARLVNEVNQVANVVHNYIKQPSRDRRLCWYAYFRPGTIDIEFTTDPQYMGDFEDLGNGYRPPIPERII